MRLDGLDPIRTVTFFRGLTDQYRSAEEGPVHCLEVGSWTPQRFDATVISHQVRLRKPNAAIFHLACERLGVAPEDAVFVDDLEPNVLAARALGMDRVHHVEAAVTLARLSEVFGVF